MGLVPGDNVLLDTSGMSGAFRDDNVGTGKTVDISGLSITGGDAGNYNVNLTATATASITARTLIVTATGIDKEYNGNTAGTVTLSSDKLGSDSVTLAYTAATFSDKNVANGKTVNVTGIFITGGADAGNYQLSSTTATTTANITENIMRAAAMSHPIRLPVYNIAIILVAGVVYYVRKKKN